MRWSASRSSVICLLWASRLCWGLAILLGLGHQLVEELVHRLLQLIHQLLDLLVRGAAVERILQGLLGRAQRHLRIADPAFLQPQRRLPQHVLGPGNLGAGLVLHQPPPGDAQRQSDDGVVVVGGRVIADGEQPARHREALVGCQRQLAALLDDRLGDGIGEDPRRQDHVDGLGLAGLAGGIAWPSGSGAPACRPRDGR